MKRNYSSCKAGLQEEQLPEIIKLNEKELFGSYGYMSFSSSSNNTDLFLLDNSEYIAFGPAGYIPNDPNDLTLVHYYDENNEKYFVNSTDLIKPIAIEKLPEPILHHGPTPDPFVLGEPYYSHYLLITKEENDFLVNYLDESGEIVLQRGIPLFNSGINSGELIFGIDINGDGMQAGLPEGLVEIDKLQKAQEIGITAFENNSSTIVYQDHSTDNGDIYVSSHHGGNQIALMDEIGFNFGPVATYLNSHWTAGVIGAEFITNEYYTDPRVEVGDVIVAHYDIDNYDESNYYGESINYTVFDSTGNFKHSLENFDDNYSINYLENLFGLDLNDDYIKGGLQEDNNIYEKLNEADQFEKFGFETFEKKSDLTDLYIDKNTGDIYLAESNDPHNKTLILHYGGSSYGAYESMQYYTDIPIAIELITDDATGLYLNHYLMIVQEEEYETLTGYIIKPDGQIIMDVGLDPSSPNNLVTNALENLFGFDFNSDNIQASLKEGIQWEDEIHIAKMLGFNTFIYTPGNTDLFIDYSSDYRDIYFAPSELTYDIFGNVNYENYYGTNGTKHRLNEFNGSSFILESGFTPVAIEQITDPAVGEVYGIGNYVLIAYDNNESEFEGYLFDNYGFFLQELGSPNNDKEINDVETFFNIDINNDGSKGLDLMLSFTEEVFDIDVYIDHDSFTRNGIIRELYEPFILEAVNIWEEVITEGLPDVIAGDVDGQYGDMPVSYIWEDVDPYLSNTTIDDIAITFSAFDYGDSNSDYFTIGDGLITEIRYEYDGYTGDITQIGLPSQGRIRFGTNEYIYDNFDMTALAVHEIAHVLGFGVLWYNDLGLPYDLPAPWNQHGLGDLVLDFGYDHYGDKILGYVGENALEAYSDITGYSEPYIPVEVDFGGEYLVENGSNFYHWDYYDGPQDLMLPILESSELSTVTIESLKDIGYDIIDFGESHTQLVNYISTALSIENDLTNTLFVASELNEDQTNIQQII